MGADRITKIWVAGLRSLSDVRLSLDGIQVLIGENGSGKSSLVEAFELMRRLSGPKFIEEIYRVHGGVPQLLRFGSKGLILGVEVEGDDGPMRYQVDLQRSGDGLGVARESLLWGPAPGYSEPLKVIVRTPASAQVFDQVAGALRPVDVSQATPLLSAFGMLPPQRAIGRLTALLSKIQVQVPFDTTPSWVARDTRNGETAMRGSVVVEPTDRISRLGGNLANAWLQLRNEYDEEHWRETMELVRLGLGPEFESVNVKPPPGGGSIGLRVKIRGLTEQVPAFSLSEGTLAFLAFVALYRLAFNSSVVVFDEPETHLHPSLLARVVDMFEDLAEDRGVVLATHSDRLLDGLKDPARAAVLCELDSGRATRLLRPKPEVLNHWLDKYRGIGQIRSEGFEKQIFTSDPA